jgi:hypothetical protein
MIKFNYTYTKFWDHKTPINWILALPFDIEDVELEIEYGISRYVPGNWHHQAEGGELEDWNVAVVDNRFNEKQRKIIADNLDENAIVAAIWEDYDANKD